MKTIEDRLATVLSLLPEHEQRRFAAPFAKGESADNRLTDAVRSLARTEGLSCTTEAEMALARARVLAQVARQPATPPPAAEDEAAALAARFAAHTISRVEAGETIPGVHVVARLAWGVEATLTEFFGGRRVGAHRCAGERTRARKGDSRKLHWPAL